MPAGQRPLPTQPSLRYLKLEAKRRLAAGEFPSLHDVQGAIAREYGQPSWAALKQFISGQPRGGKPCAAASGMGDRPVRGRRRADLDAPGEHELRQHFSDEVFTVLSAAELVAEILSKAPDLRGDLVVVDQAPLAVRARIADTELFAAAEESPPHRLIGIQPIPLGSRSHRRARGGIAARPHPRRRARRRDRGSPTRPSLSSARRP